MTNFRQIFNRPVIAFKL